MTAPVDQRRAPVRAAYALGSAGLDVTLTGVNTGGTAAPYGVGQHPYLTVGTDPVDAALLTAPARHWLRTDEQGLPVGRESVDGTAYDFRTGTGLIRLEPGERHVLRWGMSPWGTP
ncbi:hypothetical protein ABZZ20_26780 [Streptomyces sp. NPDC006430]|uniref:aldose epimerase family protein n=1 Tax=Streptomyces sp. NPDC006430 TaxID=3154299 RepID=UPI0033A041A0